MSTFRAMTFDKWWNEFKPIKNQLAPHERSCDGTLFETYGDELKYVHEVDNHEPYRVWTLLDCDGVLVIGDGYHHVNRVGYFITEHPSDSDTDYEVEYE